MIQSIAVFCGSKSGRLTEFTTTAQQLATELVKLNIRVIYGGGNKGLMGVIANTVLNQGGKITGIIPTLLKDKEHMQTDILDMRVVPDMHTRKKMMYEACDAAVVLSGGYGTLDELFEMITWNQLQIHHKKILLLNIDGFYDALVMHLNKIEAFGFDHADWRNYILVFDQVTDMVNWIRAL